jgi:hypothetical protein
MKAALFPADGVLLDDLDDPVGAGIDQNGAVINHRVTVLGHAILARHLVIGDAAGRQVGADPDLPLRNRGRVSSAMPPATAPTPAPTAAPTGPPTTAPVTAPVVAPAATPFWALAAIGNESAAANVTVVNNLRFMECPPG